MKIFILHGWTYQIDTWQPLVDMLRGRGLDIQLLKIPGLTDGTDVAWTLDDYVQWLGEQTAPHDTFILYGHSNGGRISLAFAGRYPEKVIRLILEDSAGMPPTGMRRLKRDFFKLVSSAGRALTRLEWLRNFLYKLIRENDYRAATPAMRKTMANLLSVDLSPALEKIQMPTLIIWGAQDAITPLAAGERIHKGIHGSRLIVIPDARHSPHITHPHVVADIISKELQGI